MLVFAYRVRQRSRGVMGRKWVALNALHSFVPVGPRQVRDVAWSHACHPVQTFCVERSEPQGSPQVAPLVASTQSRTTLAGQSWVELDAIQVCGAVCEIATDR